MGLSVSDILVLDYFDGRPVHTKMPAADRAVYGDDAQQRLDRLYAEGWIRESRPQETVNMLPDRALSAFLERYGLSGEGSHVELVRRVVGNIPEKDYGHAVPRIYVVSQKGKAEIGHNMAYVLNIRDRLGLTDGEIGEARSQLMLKEAPSSARDILAKALESKTQLLSLAGEWTKVRNMYHASANFYLSGDNDEEALSYFFLVFFMDMSGMGNKNTVVPYENLYPTQPGTIRQMDETRRRLKIATADVKTAFLSAIARMAPKLPFSYFSPQIMAKQLMESLAGVEFNPTKYIAERNVPDVSSKAYHYVPWGKSETERLPKPKVTVPRVMAPPVLRMPEFTRPVPFVPSEARGAEKEIVPSAGEEITESGTTAAKGRGGLLGRFKKLF